MKKKIAVAMSGGVDSSVAAALLLAKGYEVIGITMGLCSFIPGKGLVSSCPEDAKKAAKRLGIEHFVIDLSKQFGKKVIDYFCREYSLGRTPNPCVRCNQYLKFGELLRIAASKGAGYLGTGHYARIVKTDKDWVLKKAKDRTKDQSYFLYRLNQDNLGRIVFPLGKYTKKDVRGIAQKLGLAAACKADSQEICFLQGTEYREFLKEKAKAAIKPGQIIDVSGKVLGQHKGLPFYTIGQREGLGISLGYPAYVIDIDSRNNRLVVGSRDGAYSKEFIVKDINLISGDIKKKIDVKVRIRYNHKEASAVVRRIGSSFSVVFKRPQFAITPGQSAVFYDGDSCIGGGVIDKVLRSRFF